MGGLTLDFRPMLPVVTHDRGLLLRVLGKMDRFGGMYCCLRGLMGPHVVPEFRYGVPGEGWVWDVWVGGLALDFRPTLPVFTHNTHPLRIIVKVEKWPKPN